MFVCDLIFQLFILIWICDRNHDLIHEILLGVSYHQGLLVLQGTFYFTQNYYNSIWLNSQYFSDLLEKFLTSTLCFTFPRCFPFSHYISHFLDVSCFHTAFHNCRCFTFLQCVLQFLDISHVHTAFRNYMFPIFTLRFTFPRCFPVVHRLLALITHNSLRTFHCSHISSYTIRLAMSL